MTACGDPNHPDESGHAEGEAAVAVAAVAAPDSALEPIQGKYADPKPKNYEEEAAAGIAGVVFVISGTAFGLIQLDCSGPGDGCLRIAGGW